jgi:hypothetical protein
MFKTIIRTTACLAVSAAAFIVITKMDANAGRRRSSVPEEEPTPAAPGAPKSTAAPKKPKAPPPKLELASLAMPATTTPAATAPTATAKTGLDSTLTVPDWKGKRLSVARREARKLGFNVIATDENGEAVPADVASSYRVRRQLTAAGTAVEPGAEVQLRVREIVDSVAGY